MSYNSIICDQTRESQVYYEQIGSYQGEWVLFTYKDGKFFLREGGYGSCSGCDDYIVTFGYEDYDYEKKVIDTPKVIEFVGNYPVIKEFTIEDVLSYKGNNPTLHGFVPISLQSWHEEGYDKSIIEGLEACIKYADGKNEKIVSNDL